MKKIETKATTSFIGKDSTQTITQSLAFATELSPNILDILNVSSIEEYVKAELHNVIIMQNDRGINTFLCGMSRGFEMLAAETVFNLKKERSDISLIAIVPFMGQELNYSAEDKKRFEAIYDHADEVIFTAEKYTSDAIDVRNDYMIEHSSNIITYSHDANCTISHKAEKKHKIVTKLFDLLYARISHKVTSYNIFDI